MFKASFQVHRSAASDRLSTGLREGTQLTITLSAYFDANAVETYIDCLEVPNRIMRARSFSNLVAPDPPGARPDCTLRTENRFKEAVMLLLVEMSVAADVELKKIIGRSWMKAEVSDAPERISRRSHTRGVQSLIVCLATGSFIGVSALLWATRSDQTEESRRWNPKLRC